MESVVAAMVSVSVTDFVCTGPLESVTVNVTPPDAVAVGVPVIAPVDAFSVNPAGRLPPVTVHVYGEVPPLTASEALYAVPTVPAGSDVVVMLSADATIVSVTVTDFACAGALESVTVNVTRIDADDVGVPVIAPVDAFSANPAGRLPPVTVQV